MLKKTTEVRRGSSVRLAGIVKSLGWITVDHIYFHNGGGGAVAISILASRSCPDVMQHATERTYNRVCDSHVKHEIRI